MYTYQFFMPQQKKIILTYGRDTFTLNGKDIYNTDVFNVLMQRSECQMDDVIVDTCPTFWKSVQAMDPNVYQWLKDKAEGVWGDILVGYEPSTWLVALVWRIAITNAMDTLPDIPFDILYGSYENPLNSHSFILQSRYGFIEMNQRGVIIKSEGTIEETASIRKQMLAFCEKIDWSTFDGWSVLKNWLHHYGRDVENRDDILQHIVHCTHVGIFLDYMPSSNLSEGNIHLV